MLAGVGPSWYQWLEQGRDISVSPQILDAVARVLRLDNAELRHLYRLAGQHPPEAAAEPQHDHVTANLQRLIDAWLPAPAHLMDAYWNRVASNRSSLAVFGIGAGSAQNCLVDYFTNPVYRTDDEAWQINAHCLVAQYRNACSTHRDDAGFAAVVEQAAELSPEFAGLWSRRDVAPGGVLAKVIHHPEVGELHLESTQLQVPSRPDLTLVLHTPDPETDTADKLARLAARPAG